MEIVHETRNELCVIGYVHSFHWALCSLGKEQNRTERCSQMDLKVKQKMALQKKKKKKRTRYFWFMAQSHVATHFIICVCFILLLAQ